MNNYMGVGGGIASGGSRAPPVCLAVHAYIGLDEAMIHAVLRGRDSWADFPSGTHEDVSDNATAVTFSVRESGSASGARIY